MGLGIYLCCYFYILFIFIIIGKTIQAIAICAYYQEEWPVLVITPASVQLQWAEVLLFIFFLYLIIIYIVAICELATPPRFL